MLADEAGKYTDCYTAHQCKSTVEYATHLLLVRCALVLLLSHRGQTGAYRGATTLRMPLLQFLGTQLSQLVRSPRLLEFLCSGAHGRSRVTPDMLAGHLPPHIANATHLG